MSDNQIPGLPEDNMSFNFRKTPVSKETQENNWRKVKEAISTQVPVRNINWFKRLTAAASVALLIGAGAWYAVNYFSSSAEQSSNLYKTEFAKTKKIILPDGSKVTLNANSELKLSAAWNEGNERQVWLEGEAYFEVEKKLATNQKFIVHTKDLDVEVLGTKFNVNTRHKKALVSLEEGKIKLSLKEDPTAPTKQKLIKNVIEMKPGEVIKIDTGFSLQAEKNISFHSGWIRNEFHFNNSSLKDISTLIFDTYGYIVVVEDQELLKRTISGDLRANNLNELIEVLQVAFKLKMTITNKTVNIGRF